MKRSILTRWVAVLGLVIGMAATPVAAEETGTVTVTGTFTGPGGDGSWTLTMYGTTYSHFASDWKSGGSVVSNRFTDVYAASFDLEFAGPDADLLNATVGAALAGGEAGLEMRNVYQGGFQDWATIAVWVLPPEEDQPGSYLWATHEFIPSLTLFPADADGYPVVTAEPFSIDCEVTYIYGDGVYVESYADTVTIAGDMGSMPPPPPPVESTLSIGDASVLEGDRGSATLKLVVELASASAETVTVDYRTVDGTAVASGTGKNKKSGDYRAATGTLTFRPGETVKEIAIAVKGDRAAEADETFTVELLHAVGASIADGVATATIVDDD